MDGAEGACPNCGHKLSTYRTETQPAGERRVRLHWLICAGCRHVLLHSWVWLDDESQDGDLIRERLARESSTDNIHSQR